MSTNNPVIRRNTVIGNVSAEADDEFLFPCFIDNDSIDEIRSLETQKMFVAGRTGSGKTAALRKIENEEGKAVALELSELSMNYIANSDIIRFVSTLDVDLSLFYQALWKHIFCIEYIRVKYNVNNEKDSKNIFEKFSSLFDGDNRKKRAIDYLKSWEGKFWITMDENIKEITSNFENEFEGAFGTELKKFKTNAGYRASLSKEKKAQLTQRAKQIVNSEQLSDLSKVLDLLSEDEKKNKYSSRYYILLDRLDEKWVDEGIRYDLIRSLIECLRGMRKIRDLKIVVAMREDVLEKVIQTNEDSGFQREKFNDYFSTISWSKEDLYRLVNKRINHLFKRKYSSENIFFKDIFEEKVGNEPSFRYLVDRTLLRPRDIIEFVNECIGEAVDEEYVSQRAIRRAERKYSRKRLSALIDEWQNTMPTLPNVFREITNKGAKFLPNQDFWDHEFLENIAISFEFKGEIVDPVYMKSLEWANNGTESKKIEFAQEILSMLYRIGAIGLKMHPSDPYWYSTKEAAFVEPRSIPTGTKAQVHQMLTIALNVGRIEDRKKRLK